MGAIELKRCPHCVGFLSAVPVDETHFAAPGPALVCERCDAGGIVADALSVPPAWE
jgi:hypothetical protein